MVPFEIHRDDAALFSCFNQGEFECSDGRGCIVDRLRCNGVHDCLDKSDEVGCGDGPSGRFRVTCAFLLQCPLDIATLDIAAALPIATSTPMTDLRQYINYNLVYNDRRIRPLCSKYRPLSVAISSVKSL